MVLRCGMAAIAVIPIFMPFALCRGKRKATYRIRKHEVTHTFRKVSDRGNNSRKDHHCPFDQSAIFRIRKREVTYVAKKAKRHIESESARSPMSQKQSDISDSEVKGHHTRKPGASFFIKFHKEIRPKPDFSVLLVEHKSLNAEVPFFILVFILTSYALHAGPCRSGRKGRWSWEGPSAD